MMMKDLTYKDSRIIKQRELKVFRNIPLADHHEDLHEDRQEDSHARMAKNDRSKLRTFLMKILTNK